MKIRAMIEQDLLDVAKIHKEAFSRQLHSEQWISQKQGIGSSLISESLRLIKEELNQRDASIKHILVLTRTDNEAQKLYRKFLSAQSEVIVPNLFSADEVLMISRNPPI